ncbi:MAG: hypothetical protein AB7T31_16905 [Gemmatimonadales bacterium]
MKRFFVGMVVAGSLSMGIAACEGPMGPAGVPGPGTRLVLNGTTDDFGEAAVDLPAEAGTIDSPPAVTCYLSGTGQAWIVLGFDTDSDTDVEAGTDNNFLTACLLDQGTGGNLIVAVVGAPVGWFFRVVVIY